MPPRLGPPVKTIHGVKLAATNPETTWNIAIGYLPDSPEGVISSINPNYSPSTSSPPSSPLALPALVHPHIHLDKAYVHSTSSNTDLFPSTGSFQEALTLTSTAKASFTGPDLLQRGEWLLAESVASGVTAMRAFVEVDQAVQHACLDAGLDLKQKWQEACEIQLVCFAQDPVISTTHANENKRLIEDAIQKHGPDKLAVLGTTPYVESSIEASKRNIEWAVDTAMRHDRHLDFHLDYNLAHLEDKPEPLVWHVLRTLRAKGWTARTTDKRVMLGHCTRLSLFTEEDWGRLAHEIHDNDLPVSFVGLPTSDLYMAAAPSNVCNDNPRGTLPIPSMIKNHGLDAVIGINNVGNAFTPWGSADPLSLACLGVGIYQAGTVSDAELLYECVSTRARAAIGLSSSSLFRIDSSPQTTFDVRLKCGDPADLLLLNDVDDTGLLETGTTRARKTVAEVVWDPPARTSRAVVLKGRVKMPSLSTGCGAAFRFVEQDPRLVESSG
ncbi:putative zinc metallopeptidase [Aspergillus foveolatus]|uniref:putative zinc metallopeptidase n=1 Tax=Aspergillus foveolatus TaxID=210207 RepID=UPI003CCD65C6